MQALLGHQDVKTTMMYTHVLHFLPPFVTPSGVSGLSGAPLRRGGQGDAIARQ